MADRQMDGQTKRKTDKGIVFFPAEDGQAESETDVESYLCLCVGGAACLLCDA